MSNTPQTGGSEKITEPTTHSRKPNPRQYARQLIAKLGSDAGPKLAAAIEDLSSRAAADPKAARMLKAARRVNRSLNGMPVDAQSDPPPIGPEFENVKVFDYPFLDEGLTDPPPGRPQDLATWCSVVRQRVQAIRVRVERGDLVVNAEFCNLPYVIAKCRQFAHEEDIGPFPTKIATFPRIVSRRDAADPLIAWFDLSESVEMRQDRQSRLLEDVEGLLSWILSEASHKAGERTEASSPAPKKEWTKEAANDEAMRLAKLKNTGIPHGSIRKWAAAIGCSIGLVDNLEFWQKTMEVSGRGRKKAGRKPKAVSFTPKLEATNGHGEPGQILADLIAEQEKDNEPSPLDRRPRSVYTKKRV